MADTGCQSCLVGIEVINRLGLTHKDLIPVTMKMHVANNKDIKILGAAILRFSGRGKAHHILETRLIVYVTDSSNKIFRSREACVALSMIPKSFPTILEVHHACAIQPTSHSHMELRASGHDNGITAPCACPKRDPPPTPPTKLLFRRLRPTVTKSTDILGRLLQVKHIQHVQASAPTHDEWPTHE